jgi:hypothetical protein
MLSRAATGHPGNRAAASEPAVRVDPGITDDAAPRRQLGCAAKWHNAIPPPAVRGARLPLVWSATFTRRSLVFDTVQMAPLIGPNRTLYQES